MSPKRHKYAGASAIVTTACDPERIAQLAEEAAKRAGSVQVMIRLEEAQPGRLIYSARNRLLGGRIEFMTFTVTCDEVDGRRRISTRILTYKVKRNWVLVVPLPWRMIAWPNYRDFMYALRDLVVAEDQKAETSVIERAV